TPGITFQNGRVAMYVTTNAVVADFANAPFDKGVVPMPAGRAGRVVRNVPFGVHVAKGSKHHDAAWEYAVFQAGAESERIMLGAQVSAPWHKASLSGQEFARTLHPWQSAAAYVETVNKVRPTRYVKRFTDINRIYGPAYARVWAGEKTAPAAIGEIKTQINELLRKA
ncbi:MAG TPA: extracellular solute-binding protein, partial [Chloroflexota bacterium]|nr:extracellular solute-binding protein [Chloroflexota bacterium]